MKLALKITPQRNTQYANMTSTLAAPELLASPLATSIQQIEPVTLAGHNYLLVDFKDKDATHSITSSDLLSTRDLAILGRLGATSEVFEYFERIGDVPGPLLRPIETPFTPFVPLEMAEIRRYKGKTNEVFAQILLNIAIFAGAYREQFTERLRILDPLMGGGTTLFLALAAGHDAFGIDHERQDIETTAIFIQQFLNSKHISYKELDERGRKAGRRYQFTIGPKKSTRVLVLVHGDTRQANFHMQEVPGGPHMHAIVGDLPYGIQHFGEISGLLSNALPVWENMLLPGGTLALSWNATHLERKSIIELLGQHTRLHVRNDPPFTQLAHTVDRVIKRRDIIVGVKEE